MSEAEKNDKEKKKEEDRRINKKKKEDMTKHLSRWIPIFDT